jgi:hypothetical protein
MMSKKKDTLSIQLYLWSLEEQKLSVVGQKWKIYGPDDGHDGHISRRLTKRL